MSINTAAGLPSAWMQLSGILLNRPEVHLSSVLVDGYLHPCKIRSKMGKSALNKAQTTPEALHSRQHYMHYDIAEEMFELWLPSQQP